MKKVELIIILLLTIASGMHQAAAQGTAFTYQGVLTDTGGPLTGFYDLTFSLYDSVGPGSGNLIGSPNPNSLLNVPVSGGLVSINLDFGAGAFTGGARWLEITVHPHAGGATTTLSPRQPLTPTPYSIFAEGAASANGVVNASISAAQLNTTPSSPTSGQYLTYNGSGLAWSSLNAAGGLTLPYSGTTGSSGPAFSLNNTGTGPVANLLGNGVLGTAFQEKIQSGSFTLALGANSTAAEVQSQGGIPLYINHGGNDVIMVDSGGGNVGIGTTSPGAELEVSQAATGVTTILGRGADANFNINVLQDKSSNDPGSVIGQVGLAYGPGADQAAIRFHRGNFIGDSSLSFMAGGVPVLYVNADDTLYTPGFIGIGTTPTLELDISSPQGRERIRSTANSTDGSVLTLRNDTSGLAIPLGTIKFASGPSSYGSEPTFSQISAGADGSLAFWTGGPSSLGIKMTVGPGNLVSVPVLQINGADVAEPFEVSSKDLPKGSLVIIDEDNPGHVRVSDHAYDQRVAGILSGANGVNSGILLKQQGFNDAGQNVALSGRVYALADASFGGIQPGDLLTTSDTPGHCMKVTDHARAQGAIIGKAMSPLESGKGMVLVLVSLQ